MKALEKIGLLFIIQNWKNIHVCLRKIWNTDTLREENEYFILYEDDEGDQEFYFTEEEYINFKENFGLYLDFYDDNREWDNTIITITIYDKFVRCPN